MRPRDADGLANSVDANQTAPLGLLLWDFLIRALCPACLEFLWYFTQTHIHH